MCVPCKRLIVAPFAGAWIEMSVSMVGFPSASVAPFAGAWIEIARMKVLFPPRMVAPFAGAWIEITGVAITVSAGISSLPSRERGLKLLYLYFRIL